MRKHNSQASGRKNFRKRNRVSNKKVKGFECSVKTYFWRRTALSRSYCETRVPLTCFASGHGFGQQLVRRKLYVAGMLWYDPSRQCWIFLHKLSMVVTWYYPVSLNNKTFQVLLSCLALHPQSSSTINNSPKQPLFYEKEIRE